jgi:hypothetical protein
LNKLEETMSWATEKIKEQALENGKLKQRLAELEALLNEAKVIYFAPPLDLPPISRSDHLYVLERFNRWLPRVDAVLTHQLTKETQQ